MISLANELLKIACVDFFGEYLFSLRTQFQLDPKMFRLHEEFNSM